MEQLYQQSSPHGQPPHQNPCRPHMHTEVRINNTTWSWGTCTLRHSNKCPISYRFCEASHAPDQVRTAVWPLTAERTCSAGLGHHATEDTGLPRSQTRTQRAVATSQSRMLPSAEPDASHWPLASGATESTCRSAKRCIRDLLRGLQSLESGILWCYPLCFVCGMHTFLEPLFNPRRGGT